MNSNVQKMVNAFILCSKCLNTVAFENMVFTDIFHPLRVCTTTVLYYTHYTVLDLPIPNVLESFLLLLFLPFCPSPQSLDYGPRGSSVNAVLPPPTSSHV